MKKAYSVDGEEYWVTDRKTLLDLLTGKLHAENERDLIGAEYFEGDQVPVTTGELFDVDSVIDIIHENAWEIMGEYAEDYPDLTDGEQAELKGMIVAFFDKKDPRGYFKVENAVKKTVTAEDLRGR
jgi:hypothetical protein